MNKCIQPHDNVPVQKFNFRYALDDMDVRDRIGQQCL